MKPTDKDKSKGTSFWGMFFSITLHVTIIVLVLFWGFSGTSMNGGSNGPIEVSLSGLEGGGGGGGRDNKPKEDVKPLPEPKKAEPVKQPEPEKKETVKAPPPEPEKKEPPKEPEKKVEVKKEEPEKEEPKKEEPEKVEEKPKEEVVKKEPEKKEVVPIEPEEKVEKPKEPEKKVEKKEEKKEVAKKPEPTEKPKKVEKKKTETAKKKNLESEKSKVLHDIQRKKVLDQLKQGSGEAPEEEIGEERRLAMADNADLPEGPGEGPGEPGARSGGGGGGSSINPVLMQIYTNKVHQRISRNWRIPPGVPTDGSLVSVVFFKVDGSGRVYDVRINKSSGNSAFDQFCVDAIYKSAPLPPPPSEFAEEAKNDGVLVPFRNEPF